MASGLKGVVRMRKSAAFVFASLLATGCLPPFDPGNAPSTQNGSGGGTATGGGGGGATATDDLGSSTIADLGTHGDLGGAAGGDMAVACDSLQSTAGLSSPSGNHNAGQECQGCHAPGGGAPTFYLGGTLYNAVSGGAAVAGATLNVTDANGKKVKIVSANNGNFWTTTTLAFPIKVDASLCPATVPMVATVGGNGACNNCHNSAMRVHVP
jgi:hypothetical protein